MPADALRRALATWACRRGLLAVDGVLETDGDVHHLVAERLRPFDELLRGFRTRSRDFC